MFPRSSTILSLWPKSSLLSGVNISVSNPTLVRTEEYPPLNTFYTSSTVSMSLWYLMTFFAEVNT